MPVKQDRDLPKRAALVVNAKSRRGQALFARARDLLLAKGVTLTAAHAITDPSTLRDVVRKVLRDGAPMVIVGGGDGTLSCAVDDFVVNDAVFAFLPLGTANSFARTLGVPLDLEGAVDVIATGVRRRIDLGMIDGDYFANASVIGVAPLVAETVPHAVKRYFGRAGYLAWAAWQFTRFRPFVLTVGNERVEAVEVRIANGRYHGGSEMMETAKVDSGEIVVQVVLGNARHRLAWSWAASLLKLRARKRTVREFHGAELRLSTEPPLPISIDGEVLAHTPVTARVAPGVVDVAVPRPTQPG